MQVTADDRAVLAHVYRHRFLRACDLYRLFPERSADRLSRRLTQLFRHRYLDRPPSQIDRFRAGGSASLVYGLGAEGAKLLKTKDGASIPHADWAAKNRTFTRENLDHTLGVSELLVSVEVACRATERFTYLPPDEILGGGFVAKWPVPVSWRGNVADVLLIPDAVFGIRRTETDGTGRTAYFFLEYDRGTMTILPSERIERSEAFLYRSSLLRKFVTYAESYRRELHAAQFSIRAPRLLTVTPSEKRLGAMRATAASVLDQFGLPPTLFLFGTADGDGFPIFSDAASASVNLIG